MAQAEPKLYDDVVLLRELKCDGSGVVMPRGSEGHVVDVLGPGGYMLEFRVPDPRFVGGVRFEVCFARTDDFLVRVGPETRIESPLEPEALGVR